MSSKVNSALFDLIRSMSKSEKRYFKLMSSRHTIGEENNYVRLFDFLDKQSAYDENALFKTFEGEAFLNRFSITKKRLYDHVLASLDSFHHSSSVEAQLYKQLHSADILFEKSLYDQCRRILRSAERLAEKHEKHEIQLMITHKKKRLLETTGYLRVPEKEISEMHQKDAGYLNSIAQYNRLWAVKSELFSTLAKKGVARSAEEAEVYSTICADFLNKEDFKPATSESEYLYHHVLSAYSYAVGDLPTSFVHLQKNLDSISPEQKGKFLEPNKYVSALTNAIYIADKIGEQKQSLRYLGQLKKFAAAVQSNEDLSIKLFSSISSLELSMCLRKGDFESAQKQALEVISELEGYGDKIVPIRRAFLEFKLAVVYIGIGDYTSALKWINNILNDSRLDKTEDIIGFTQLLDLVVHIELDHHKLLPYTLKNTQRFFKTRNRMYSFEKVLLNCINKLIKCDDPFDRKNLWESLYNELAKITNDDIFESVALDYFDFQSWAESKLKGKSFDLIIREKYNRRMKVAS